MVVSVVSPYLVAYSCGAKLYLDRGVFDEFASRSIWYKLLLLIYVLPTGILYYVFLDFYFTLCKAFYLWPTYLFSLCQKSSSTDKLRDVGHKQRQIKLAKVIGMSLMNWEGYDKLRSISQLILESSPQSVIQICMFCDIIRISETSVTQTDILKSLIPTMYVYLFTCSSRLNQFGGIFFGSSCSDQSMSLLAIFRLNMIIQFTLQFVESRGFEEEWISYSLTTMMGKFGWSLDVVFSLCYLNKIVRTNVVIIYSPIFETIRNFR